ncbi:hypothetical protein BpHYR1_026604, partial [Brachionus plicatilis]
REKDDAISEINQLKRNLAEVTETYNRTEQRLVQQQKSLTESEEDLNLLKFFKKFKICKFNVDFFFLNFSTKEELTLVSPAHRPLSCSKKRR